MPSVTGVSNGSVGVYTVTATVTGVLVPALFVITNVAGAPIVLSAANCAQSAVAGHAFDDALDIGVLTQLGVPVAAALVSVGAQVGITIDPNATTAANGHVQLHASAGLVVGDYPITLSVLGGVAPVTCTLHVLPDVPARLVADAASANQSARVGTPFTQPYGATLYDQYDNRIPGAILHFNTPLLGASGTYQPSTAATDAQGHAASVLTAGDLTGSFLTTASADNPLVFVAFSAKATAGNPHDVQALPALPRKALVGTPYLQPLAVHVQDESGNAVPDATVRYQAPAAGASAALSELTATTDALGNAQVSATANTVAGAFVTTATVDGAMASVQFSMENLAGAAAHLTVAGQSSPQATLVGTLFAHPLTVAVSDQFDNPVQGALVAFTPPLLGASALTFLPVAATDASGVASVTATANGIAGTYDLVASALGANAHFALENLAVAPGHIVVESGGGQHGPATQPFLQPLVVRFTDGAGAPVQGASIAVSVPATGSTATYPAAPITTDAEGRASVQLTAGSDPGSLQVSLSAPGAAAPATATFVADAITTTLGLAASAPSVTQGQPVTLTVTATSAFGTPAGTAQLHDAQQALGGMTLVDGHQAVVVYLDAIGAHSVHAHLEAQGSFAASDSAAVIVTVIPEATSSSSSGGESTSSSSSGESTSSSSGGREHQQQLRGREHQQQLQWQQLGRPDQQQQLRGREHQQQLQWQQLGRPDQQQ